MKSIQTIAILATGLLLAMPSYAQEETYCKGPVITMNATGEIESIPDIAEISLNVKSRNKDEASALQDLAKNMQKVVNALDKLKVKEEDIRTDSVNIFPIYEERTRQEITGYEGTSTIYFKTRNLKNITELLSGVMEGSSNMFSDISYSSSDKDNFENEARKDAFKRAYDKAKLYAELSGNKLGQVCTISEGNINTFIPSFRNNMREDSMMMASAPKANYSIPIKPGKIKTTAYVSVVYQLQN